jgi:hypothetical protein
MLDPAKTIAALEVKREQFGEALQQQQDHERTFDEALNVLRSLSLEEATDRLAGYISPGALLTAEHDQHRDLIIPFTQSWSHHQEAREWGWHILRDVPTIAVDGSQIVPSNEMSIPVGVVQVAWFENPHHKEGKYEKELAIEILAPAELSEDITADGGMTDWKVNLRRFEMEAEKLVEYMEERAGDDPKPVCFFDGSFILSFVQHMRPDRQRRYIDAVLALINTSAATRVPVVAYIDTSYAADLVQMIGHIGGANFRGRVSDAGLLRRRMKWGDRSQLLICARDDQVIDRYYDQVCFTYLKSTGDNRPARIEFPRWIYESGQHERVLDIVRAEVVVGNGYPYSLETADAAAVISMQDRERFFALFQKFAEKHGYPLRFSRKSTSKRRRRV